MTSRAIFVFKSFFILQKRGKCKGSISLSSVKAVEFVDNTAFNQDKRNCFQVSTVYKIIVILV